MSVENPEFSQEQNHQEYQSVENINLIKVSEEETGYDDAIKISVKDEAPEDIERIVREELKKRNWWLQEYWQAKGLPKEQVDVQIGEHKITLYNFSGQLEEKHLDELRKAIQDFSKVSNGKPLQEVKYILLDDEVIENPSTGEEKRGEAGTDDSAVKIYPKGTKFDDYRKEETPNFKGVSDFEASIIHEMAHRVGVDFENKWRRKFNWKELEQPRKNKGGSVSFYETTQPERCVSNYATTFPSEDICESVVAALRKPESLDPEKLQFIKDELLGENQPLSVITERKKGAGVELPKIESVDYRTEKSAFKVKKRNVEKE